MADWNVSFCPEKFKIFCSWTIDHILLKHWSVIFKNGWRYYWHDLSKWPQKTVKQSLVCCNSHIKVTVSWLCGPANRITLSPEWWASEMLYETVAVSLFTCLPMPMLLAVCGFAACHLYVTLTSLLLLGLFCILLYGFSRDCSKSRFTMYVCFEDKMAQNNRWAW